MKNLNHEAGARVDTVKKVESNKRQVSELKAVQKEGSVVEQEELGTINMKVVQLKEGLGEEDLEQVILRALNKKKFPELGLHPRFTPKVNYDFYLTLEGKEIKTKEGERIEVKIDVAPNAAIGEVSYYFESEGSKKVVSDADLKSIVLQESLAQLRTQINNDLPRILVGLPYDLIPQFNEKGSLMLGDKPVYTSGMQSISIAFKEKSPKNFEGYCFQNMKGTEYFSYIDIKDSMLRIKKEREEIKSAKEEGLEVIEIDTMGRKGVEGGLREAVNKELPQKLKELDLPANLIPKINTQSPNAGNVLLLNNKPLLTPEGSKIYVKIQRDLACGLVGFNFENRRRYPAI